MSVEGLEFATNDELIEELINRTTFAGVVVGHRSNITNGQVENNLIMMAKSPPLSEADTEALLRSGLGLVPRLK